MMVIPRYTHTEPLARWEEGELSVWGVSGVIHNAGSFACPTYEEDVCVRVEKDPSDLLNCPLLGLPIWNVAIPIPGYDASTENALTVPL